jgi:hypothetical protein
MLYDDTSRGDFARILLDMAETNHISTANESTFFPNILNETEEQKKDRLLPVVEEIWKTDVRIVFLMIGDDDS